MSLRFKIASIVLVVGMSLGLTHQAIASEYSLKVSPAFQELELNQDVDRTITSVTITNLTDITLDLELFAVDFIQSDETGAVAYVNQLDKDYRLAEYITIPEDTVQISAGESQPIKVEILNRDDLTVGGHYGAIVARVREQNVGDFQQVLPAVSSMFLVHKVGGERYNLSLQSFSIEEPWLRRQAVDKVSVSLRNEGNIHLIPQGLVTATDLFDRVVYKGLINDSSSYVLPETKRTFIVPLQQLRPGFPAMIYRVDINGTSDGDTPFFASDYLVFIHPYLSVGVVALVLAIGGFWWRIKGSKREDND